MDLPLALIVRVFQAPTRASIGQASAGRSSSAIRRPALTSEPLPLRRRWTPRSSSYDIPQRRLQSSADEPIDLFNDLVSKDGKIEVLVKCLERGQYFGFAQADCYIRHARRLADRQLRQGRA